MVIWSKSFDHDHDQNFLNNHGQMMRTLTMTMEKVLFTTNFDLKIPYLNIEELEVEDFRSFH